MNFRLPTRTIAAAPMMMFILAGGVSPGAVAGTPSEARPSKDVMRGKIQKKREERKRNGGAPKDSVSGTSDSPPPAEKSAADEVSRTPPMTRTFLLATLATELRPEYAESENGAKRESSPTEGGDRSLLDAVLGFESEIEPHDPETRIAIDQARVKSGLPPSKHSPETDSIEWESAPTTLE